MTAVVLADVWIKEYAQGTQRQISPSRGVSRHPGRELAFADGVAQYKSEPGKITP